jgi:hypothetical protein
VEVFARCVARMYEPSCYHEVFHILFENNPKLKPNIVEIQEAIFKNPNDSPGIMLGLLWSPCHVVITKGLVDAATSNPRGAEAMEILLFSGNTIHMELEDFSALLSYSSRQVRSTGLQAEPRLLNRFKYMKFDVQTYMNACAYLWPERNDIFLSTIMDADLSELGADRIKGLIELSWEDLAMARKLEMGRDCLLLLLYSQPKISRAAINMLISRWDVDVVKALLNFQKVEVTNEIIRCAAGNFNHGTKIMQLLISSENVEFGN